MKKLFRLMAIIFAIAAAGIAGIMAGRSDMNLPGWLPSARAPIAKAGAEPAGTGPVIYYRDPDGLAAFSAVPTKTRAGKDYLPVRTSQDIQFEKPPENGEKQVAPASDAKRIKFYRNPMGMPDTSPTPKKDSMGMDYLPVYHGDEEVDGNTVKVGTGKLQRAGVRSEPVALAPLGIPLRAPGTIQLDERRVSVVALRFEGFIEAVENVTTGASVRKGQPLMRVYGPALSSAAAEYVSVLNGRPDGPIPAQGLKGARRRLENLAVPDAALSAIERMREVPVAITWPAPQDGVILERAAVTGMRAAPGDVLFRIADTSLIWAQIDLAERDVDMVAAGQEVTVTPRGMRGKTFIGKIALVYPQINKQTRTGRVRVELDNPDGVLKPDMYVEAQIATGTDKPVLSVADSAVIDSGQRQIVLIDKGEGRFEPRQVKLGRRGAGRVEIMEGVAADDKVVVSANFLIDAESNLKAALQGLDSGEKQP